jgi:predicted DNA-binding WGR domain protein
MSYAKKVLKLYLTVPAEHKDREYHIIVEASGTAGYHVYGMNGRRGAANTRQSKTATGPVTLSAAESIFSTLVDDKRKKGYTTEVSGRPFSGISLAAATLSGTAPTAPPAKPATPLVATPWFNTAGEDEFGALLEDEQFAAQELIAGERVLAEVGTTIRCQEVASGANVTLPPAILAELKKAAQNFVVDGVFSAASERFAILDGYRVASPTSEGPTAPFELRIASLAAQVKSAKVKHVEVLPAYTDEDKFALACAMQNHGRQRMLLRKNRAAYEMAAPGRSDATVILHNF